MANSKGWDWESTEQSSWLKPAMESYYFANRWKQKGYRDILDLGTGLGRHAIYFSQQGFDVNAIDISEYAIEHLKAWSIHEKLSLSTIKGDILSLPYADNSFDCIFAYHVISHSDTIGVKTIIAEIERVLRIGREVFLSFCSKESNDFVVNTSNKIDQNTIICQREPEIGVPHFYVNLTEAIDLLENFKIESIRHTEYCVVDPQDSVCLGFKNKYYYVNAILNT